MCRSAMLVMSNHARTGKLDVRISAFDVLAKSELPVRRLSDRKSAASWVRHSTTPVTG